MTRRLVVICIVVAILGVPALASASAMLVNPSAAIATGHTLWIANEGGDYPNGESASVVAFDTQTGRVVHRLGGSAKGINDPVALAATPGRVWVASNNDSMLSEINDSSGRIVAEIPLRYRGCALTTEALTASSSAVFVGALCVAPGHNPAGVLLKISQSGVIGALVSPKLGRPVALVTSGKWLWVAANDQSVASSALVRVATPHMKISKVLNSPAYNLGRPDALAVVGPNLWVSDLSGHHLAVIRMRDGALLDFVSGTASCMEFPTQLTAMGSTLWVGSIPSSVLGIKASLVSVDTHTGAVLGCERGQRKGVSSPFAVMSVGSHLWVVNAFNDTLVEFNDKGSFVHEWRSPISLLGIYGR